MRSKKTECEWEGETEGIVWSFKLQADHKLFVEAVYYEDGCNKDNPRTLIKTQVPYDDFKIRFN